MTRRPPAIRARARLPRGRERGVVLLVALVALTILLVGAVALMRSSTGTLSTAGNLAFKRDLANQGERAVPVAMALLRTGALATPAARAAASAQHNYSARALPTGASGIPDILMADDATFRAAWTAPDITVTDAAGRDQRVRVRWVMDRLCADVGDETALGDQCVRAGDPVRGGNSIAPRAEDSTTVTPVVYRLSVRVDGPRGTQSYFQTTLGY